MRISIKTSLSLLKGMVSGLETKAGGRWPDGYPARGQVLLSAAPFLWGPGKGQDIRRSASQEAQDQPDSDRGRALRGSPAAGKCHHREPSLAGFYEAV